MSKPRRKPSRKATQAKGPDAATDGAAISKTTDRPGESSAPTAEPIETGGWAGWKLYLPLALGLIVFDQVSKWLSVLYLAPPPTGAGQTIVLIPNVFQLQYATNTGAAFSLFEGRVGMLAIISLMASAGMVWWWTRLPRQEHWGRTSLAMIIAGAIGNLIDRVRLGYVVDMFDAYIGTYDYPVFNVADSLICIGVVILIFRAFRGKV